MHDGVGWVVIANEGVVVAAVPPTSAPAPPPCSAAVFGPVARVLPGHTAVRRVLGEVSVVLVGTGTLFAQAVVDVPAGGPTSATTASSAPPAPPRAAIGVCLIDLGVVWSGVILQIAVDVELLNSRRLRRGWQEYRRRRIEDWRPSRMQGRQYGCLRGTLLANLIDLRGLRLWFR
jgi:hypothetical protein